jgi:hypothetical protein
MTMLYLVALTIVFAINGACSLECRQVEKDQHFTSTLPFYGFKQDRVITTRVRFQNNTARYLFPPTESKGRLCSQSWNQLWGTTRCGYLTSNHWASDRFVWRRAGSCLTYDSAGHVIHEVPKCPERNLIELAASAYDDGLKPFEHQGKLLKEFSTKLQINKWYNLKLTVDETKTIYQLSDHANRVLETQTVEHHSCESYNLGMLQGLYFGGQCPAPQPVTVCYE